jgi:hypothetical protein
VGEKSSKILLTNFFLSLRKPWGGGGLYLGPQKGWSIRVRKSNFLIFLKYLKKEKLFKIVIDANQWS